MNEISKTVEAIKRLVEIVGYLEGEIAADTIIRACDKIESMSKEIERQKKRDNG